MPPQQGQQQNGQQQQENLKVTWLLEFTDPGLERACTQYKIQNTYLISDAAVLLVNLLANATMLLRLRMLEDLPLNSRLGLVANLLASLCHGAVVRQSPRQYTHWRTPLVVTARLLRVLLVLCISASIDPHPSSWLALLLQFTMLSPASASFLSAVGLPLPLRQHLALQALVTAVTLTRVRGMCGQLSGAPAADLSQRCHQLVSFFYQLRWLNVFHLRVLPRTVAPGHDCCLPVLSVVIIAYGLVFSTIAVLTIDMASRVRFLHQVAALPSQAVALLARVVRTVWLVACVTCLSLLPVVWELAVLYHKLAAEGVGSYGLVGLAAALTSLSIESFMRVWLALVLVLISSSLFAMTGV